jgi:hypothetical protein
MMQASVFATRLEFNVGVACLRHAFSYRSFCDKSPTTTGELVANSINDSFHVRGGPVIQTETIA